MTTEIKLYSAQLCSDCQHLKSYMDENGIDYTNMDIKDDPENGVLLEKETGKLGVPYLLINGKWIRGYQVGKPFSEEFARELFDSVKEIGGSPTPFHPPTV